MNDKPQITTHYADGRESETRDMTEEEIALLPTTLSDYEAPVANS
jgi:hypothetical protein